MTTIPKTKLHVAARNFLLGCAATLILTALAALAGVTVAATPALVCASLVLGAPALGTYFFEYDQWSMNVAKAQRIAALGESHIVRGYN